MPIWPARDALSGRYTTFLAAETAVADHEADAADPHAAAGYATAAEVVTEVGDHDSDVGAHGGVELALSAHEGDTGNPHAVTAAQASAIPTAEKAAASGVASLDGSSKVVQDPANATATPTAAKIPISAADGKLNSWITSFWTARQEVPSYPNGVLVNRFYPRTNTKLDRVIVYMANTPTTAGSYTLKVEKKIAGGGTVTLLNAASYDLESITAATDTSLPLTATTADLLFTDGDVLLFTIESDNADLAGVEDFVICADLKPK